MRNKIHNFDFAQQDLESTYFRQLIIQRCFCLHPVT